MREKNFERELPQGYTEAKHINAKNGKHAVIYTALSFVPVAVTVGLCFLIVALTHLKYEVEKSDTFFTVSTLVTFAVLIVYVIAHELVHGVCYKSLTGEKLTFGLTFTCAFCGVPNIYVRKKAALIAVLMPFIVFSIIFIAVTVALFFVDWWLFLLASFILGLHLGGCVGDLHVSLILGVKFKNQEVLMRDTGPEQFFYVKDGSVPTAGTTEEE